MRLPIRLFVIALVALTPLLGQAVTLGEARLNSFLNQPLDVEIDILGLSKNQHESLRVRVANQEHFDRLGIIYSPLIAHLRFNIERNGGRWIVRARSDRAVSEPFIDFPLLMTWPGGQMVRQYTLLLDPPRQIQAARVSRPRNAPTPATPPRRSTPESSTRPITSDSYGPVKRGETLWPIASKLKPAGITTRQMAMALLRANPHAFIDNNINKLRQGAVLEIPTPAFIEELDAKTASRQFAAQMKPRRRAAISSPTAGTPVARADTTREPEPPVAPSNPPVEEPADVAEKEDLLRIVGEEQPTAESADNEENLERKLLTTMEEIETNRLNTDAIESRLARLESELERMEKLVELKDAQIDALQSVVDAQNEERTATSPVGTEPSTDSISQEEPTDVNDNEIVIDTVDQATIEAPQVAAVVAPAPVVNIETATPVTTSPAASPRWYEQNLWLLWAALALLSIAVIALLFRRPQVIVAEGAGAVPAGAAAAALPDPLPVPERDDIRDAEQDLKEVADAKLPQADTEPAQLPDIDIAQIQLGEEELEGHDDISDSVLAEMLEESRLAPGAPKIPPDDEADFDDEDIASWIKEIGNESDAVEQHSANDEGGAEQDEIPSILTELDDQLASTDAPELVDPPTLELDPLDIDPVESPAESGPAEPIIEDDTFTMSLDLARAYLEIGDQEGAKDMLQQALAGARDPDHRRQIEELLQQIG